MGSLMAFYRATNLFKLLFYEPCSVASRAITKFLLPVFNASRGMASAQIAALLKDNGFQRSEAAITAKLFRLKADNPILVKEGGGGCPGAVLIIY